MKLEILKAAAHQLNYFHSTKTTSLSCPCFSSFSSPYLESFAIYLWLYQNPSQHLPFLLVIIWQHQGAPLGRSPFAQRDWSLLEGGRSWGISVKHWASQFNFQLCYWFPGWPWPRALSLFWLLSSLSGQHSLIPILLFPYFHIKVLRQGQVEYAENQSQLAGSLLLGYCQLSLQNQIFTLTYTNIGSRSWSVQSISSHYDSAVCSSVGIYPWFITRKTVRHICIHNASNRHLLSVS